MAFASDKPVYMTVTWLKSIHKKVNAPQTALQFKQHLSVYAIAPQCKKTGARSNMHLQTLLRVGSRTDNTFKFSSDPPLDVLNKRHYNMPVIISFTF